MSRTTAVSAVLLAALAACIPNPQDLKGLSPQGARVMELVEAVREELGGDIRTATVLDGINTNVLRVDMRSKDKTLEERITRAQAVARYLKEKGAIPANHYRISFDFPVAFQVGCMPMNLYERVQLETQNFRVIQALPAQRVMSYDQQIRGQMGEVVLDDAQWNIPFFMTVDRVELAREVMGEKARPNETFVSVHARWTNIGTHVATMSDDPWRLVETREGVAGETLALLDGGSTHLARNAGSIKLPPVEPGQSQERWYVFRVPTEKLYKGSVAFARQRFAKATQKDAWQKAGFELIVPIKNGFAPAREPAEGQALDALTEDWRTLADTAVVPH
jgi:hypothetical protein